MTEAENTLGPIKTMNGVPNSILSQRVLRITLVIIPSVIPVINTQLKVKRSFPKIISPGIRPVMAALRVKPGKYAPVGGKTIKDIKSYKAPTIAPAKGPKSIPEIKIGILLKLILIPSIPAIGI